MTATASCPTHGSFTVEAASLHVRGAELRIGLPCGHYTLRAASAAQRLLWTAHGAIYEEVLP